MGNVQVPQGSVQKFGALCKTSSLPTSSRRNLRRVVEAVAELPRWSSSEEAGTTAFPALSTCSRWCSGSNLAWNMSLRLALFWVIVSTSACARSVQAGGSCSSSDMRMVVDTKAHTLVLCEAGKETATFSVRLGHGGVGKTQAGDGKTPLGVYPLGQPRVSQRFGTFIPIGYPTPGQRARGYTGSDVGVHGPHRWVRWLGSLVNSFDSSDGCVGLASDDEMAKIADWVTAARVRTLDLRARLQTS